jgi:hypothetical protein
MREEEKGKSIPELLLLLYTHTQLAQRERERESSLSSLPSCVCLLINPWLGAGKRRKDEAEQGSVKSRSTSEHMRIETGKGRRSYSSSPCRM